MDEAAAGLFWQAEVEAERTIGLLRVVVALVLALAFLGLVGTSPPEGLALGRQIGIVALTLGGYLALGLASWALAASGRLRAWMSWLFAGLDVLVVVGSLELGLLNIAAPGGHVAILPAVWLAPLVLALGALRYNPALQGFVTVLLLAGLSLGAVRGAIWGGRGSGADLDGTLSFLFGAPPNLMRLVMLALAGAVLVLAAVRARALLRRAIEETRRRAALGRYLPPEIADRLAGAGAPELRRGRRQPVAVLFADIRGFTRMAEHMDPAALGALVGAFRGRAIRIATAHGGVIDKFIGDAVMILFGVPDPRLDDAARALACARALLADTALWSEGRKAAGEAPIAIGIGLHVGPVFAGAIGDDSRLEYTVLGDVVNVAARLTELAKTLEAPLVVSADLLAAAGEDAAGWRDVAAQALRGRERPLAVYALA